jgi:hypothetical protein
MRISWLSGVALALVGCSSLAFLQPEPGELLTQEGKVPLADAEHFEVLYPIPYLYPPNLECDGAIQMKVLKQRRDGFTVEVHGRSVGVPLTWRARGLVSKYYAQSNSSHPEPPSQAGGSAAASQKDVTH